MLSKFTKGLILALYVTCFVILGILIKTKDMTEDQESQPDFSLSLLIILVELTKMTISLVLALVSGRKNLKVTIKRLSTLRAEKFRFMIISFSYFIYNQLNFINYLNFSSPMVKLMMNSRIIFTVILDYLLLSKTFDTELFQSIFLLFMGCVLGQYDNQSTYGSESETAKGFTILLNYFFLFFQAFLSSFGSVISELLYKSYNDPIHEQNFWHCTWGFLFNYVILCFRHKRLINLFALIKLLSPTKILYVILLSCGGILASTLLKHLSSITKAYASSCELFISALLSAFIFGKKISFNFIMASILVTYSVLLYTSIKTKKKKKQMKKKLKAEEKKLK
ncbi:nucleotide-sugar transmembrane transporter [Anaeramoeba flamelloides]|uniref:Nucleotide-sugar transmembrane transporter n=1 Tax=Anaeramoeba flamelloides TaxID=1746091 RepID=A0ABQ8XJF2_9EUKA|nr:nucleotide-sugar transmembrane transporter [Anaeramoeba flamelloides]